MSERERESEKSERMWGINCRPCETRRIMHHTVINLLRTECAWILRFILLFSRKVNIELDQVLSASPSTTGRHGEEDTLQ